LGGKDVLGRGKEGNKNWIYKWTCKKKYKMGELGVENSITMCKAIYYSNLID
jgi:hypothetical protein